MGPRSPAIPAPCRARSTARAGRPPGSGPSSGVPDLGGQRHINIGLVADGGEAFGDAGPSQHDPNFGRHSHRCAGDVPDALSISCQRPTLSSTWNRRLLINNNDASAAAISTSNPRHAPRGRPRPRLRRRHRPLVGDVCPVTPNGVLTARPGGAPVALRSAPARRQ